MSKTKAPLLKRKPAPRARATPVVQPKLAVGPVNDRFEREANQVADSVVSGQPVPAASPPPVISGLSAQRMAAPAAAGPEQTEEELAAPEERAQRSHRGSGPEATAKKPPDLEAIEDPQTAEKIIQPARSDASDIPGANGGLASDEVEASIERMRRRPVPGLDPQTQAKMEEGTGLDFGGARVHTDSAAGEAANALGARAFTVGQDMFFAQGQFNPKTTAGQRLIAHELTHTVQQNGGSAAAQRIQRAAKTKSTVSSTKKSDDLPEEEITKLEGKDWAVDLSNIGDHEGTVTVPKLELPLVAGALKGAAGPQNKPVADTNRDLPVEGQEFTLAKTTKRPPGKAFEAWVNFAREEFSPDIKEILAKQLKAQGNAASVVRAGEPVYVLYSGGKKAASATTILVGTLEELAKHDSIVRPMLGPKGGAARVDADHILELQIGGLDAAENMWLLDSAYNRAVGSGINTKLNATIKQTLDNAAKELKKKKNAKTSKPLPGSAKQVRRGWLLKFNTVKKGKSSNIKTFWTKQQLEEGKHLRFYKAMTEKELVKQGFKFKEGEIPTHINIFPNKDGGRAIRFEVSDDGTKLKQPKFFYRGFYVIEDADFSPPTTETTGGILTTLKVRRTKKKEKGSEIIVFAEKEITVRHDPNLGFGGYINRESLGRAFRGLDFKPLSPLTFTDVQITPDGELFAEGSLLSSKALFPQLNVPIVLRGENILIQFPVPTEKLNFGLVKVTDAALDLGMGEKGFFIQGSATILIDNVGQGTLSALVKKDDVILKGEFGLDFDFLEPSKKIEMTYSLMKDDFTFKAPFRFKKGTLPGVKSGGATVEITRQTVGLEGSLDLGGILAGSSITIGYTPENGPVIEGRDLPLPIDKLPGVSNAKVTVRVMRSPETGAWLISGGGKASLGIPGASGPLEIQFDGYAVLFKGRVDVLKGPAKGWVDITATNRAIDEEGNPNENGPVGDLKIWGKGEASIAFGKILTGTAGLEYTADGRVIISGEIALPPTYELFKKQEYKKTLLELNPPDFPIWGVKLGPVGFGIFAFVDAEIRFEAFVGPGQLRDTKVQATLDLDKPEEAVVRGTALFFVPSYAGLTLDVGGGLKAQVAVAYVKGRVGLDGVLGMGVDVSFGVDVLWSPNKGLMASTLAVIVGRPKFEVGVNASVTAGVDLWLTEIEKTWGPWRKKLGEFGPNMELGASVPLNWSEKDGLDLSLDKIEIKKPKLDAKAIMKDAFDVLV